MKLYILFGIVAVFISLTGCDKKLKEHPISPSLKNQLEMQNDPAVQSKKISGILTVDEKLVNRVSETATLFIFARPAGQESGPPLAVKRSSGTQFPHQYSIGQINTMLAGAKFEGEINITARLSREGTAKAAPGDLEGSATAQVGSEKADIVLNRLIPETTREGKTITGSISVAPELQDKIPRDAVLFVFVRQGLERKPPLAVRRIADVKLPYDFRIGQEDVMMPGEVLDGEVTLFARLDQDGKAMPSPGDLEGFKEAKAGDENIAVVLNRVVEK